MDWKNTGWTRASSLVHLFVAALLWTIVGLLLMSRGIVWLRAVNQLWIVFPSLIIGSMKSFVLLDKSARKSIERIVSTREGKCLGGVYSAKTWLLVVLMIVAGYLLRHSSLPNELLGLFYVSIGWGLFFSSRHSWVAWQQRHGQTSSSIDHK